jgi:orotate phosphoribosyltransferase
MTTDHTLALSQIVDLFFNHGVIKVDGGFPFVLSSGAKAPIYLDHRKAFTNPVLRKQLVRAWADDLETQIKNLGHRVSDVVCVGTATAGIAPAMALAMHWGCEFLYVRQKPKGHGLQQMIEGEFDNRKAHVVIDDMLTTGQSLLKSVEVLKQSQTRLILASTVTSHAIPSAHRKFDDLNLSFKSLFETQSILSIAQSLGLISQADLRIVMSWLEQFGSSIDSAE